MAWAATEGATNAGSVTFEDLGRGQTSVNLLLEYEPERLVEKAGDPMHFIEHQVQPVLDRFKEYIESGEYATGACRGAVTSDGHVGTPGVSAAAAPAATTARPASQARPSRLISTSPRPPPPLRRRQPSLVPKATPRSTRRRRSKTADARGARVLTDEEIEAGASDVPLDASKAKPKRR